MKKNILLLVIVGIIGLGTAAGQAVTWDLNTDWEAAMPSVSSPGVNPNGTWSYGNNTALQKSSFALNTAWDNWSPAADALAVWGTTPGVWPLMWHSYTFASGVGDGTGPHETCIQTGHNRPGANSVVRWTAPYAGTFNILIDWQLGYGSEGTVILWNDMVLSSTPNAQNHAYDMDIPMAAGDTIDFVALGQTTASNASVLYFTVTELTEPTDPVECVLWLDATTGLTDPNTGTPYGDGDLVKRWQDTQSGKNMQADLAWGGPTLETNEINGKNVIRFTGDDGLKIDPNSAIPLNAPNYTVYVVGRINDLALSQIFYANYSDPPAGAAVGISDTRFNTVKYFTNGNTVSSDSELIEGRFYLIAVSRSWQGEKNLYINGELIDSTLGKSKYNSGTVLSIGALDIGRQFLNGDIAEIRVYNGVDAALHDTVTTALIDKYDIDTTPVVPDPDIVSMTAMTLTRTVSTGVMIETQERYNTFFEDAAWDMAVYEGELITNPALYDPNNPGDFWLSHPNYLMLDIPLAVGQERSFNWHCAYGSADVPYMGVNLFFDDGQYTNKVGISVYAQMDGTGPGDGTPAFLANSAASTMGWPYTSVPGTGSLIYYDTVKQMKVTMTNFVVYHPDVYDLDFIGAQVQDPNSGINPILDGNDGATDLVGRFTLKVETLDCQALDHFAADINTDCRVDLNDFALLIASWLDCYDPQNPAECTNP